MKRDMEKAGVNRKEWEEMEAGHQEGGKEFMTLLPPKELIMGTKVNSPIYWIIICN